MQINIDSVIEKSAFIIEGEKREKLMGDFNNIIELVSKLDELDTQEVEPLVFITDNTNIIREDNLSDKSYEEGFFSNSKDSNSDYFVVPKFSSN